MARVGGDGWRGNFGVRLVGTQENAYVNVPTAASDPAAIKTSAFGNYFINHVEHTYFDVLPSVNFTFDLKPNLFCACRPPRPCRVRTTAPWAAPSVSPT